MNDTVAGWLTVALLVAALAAVHIPMGNYLARVYGTGRHLRVERGLYRVMGVDPDADQTWPTYLKSVLAFSAISVLLLYGFQRLQNYLWLSLGLDPVAPDQAWNTAVSFVTNTNWQSYSGESTMGHLVQMSGLAVQNFVSAAVGIVVAIALVRGFARSKTDRLGNFWVDLTRGSLRVLLPLSILATLVFISAGLVQNLSGGTEITAIAGGAQHIPGGPVASQEAIKEIGTNGGGFYNANSSHPFEGPTAWISLFQIFLILLIPFSLPRAFGKLVGDVRQGYAIAAVMGILWAISVALLTWSEMAHPGTAPNLAGGAMEGKETRFGVPLSALFGASTTLTSTGSVNSFHDSYTAFGGGLTIFNMLLGEIAPGGVGSGLYGMLVLAIVAVFVAGLMVGRTPEYLKKKIGPREIKLAAAYILTTPALVLIGTAVAISIPEARESMNNTGAHGFSEVVYAFASPANNNGSAFAGLNANTPFWNIATGLAMALGRFVPMALVLALAGSLAQQRVVPETAGTLATHKGMFVGMTVGVILILVGLTFFPTLALGPLAEGLQ